MLREPFAITGTSKDVAINRTFSNSVSAEVNSKSGGIDSPLALIPLPGHPDVVICSFCDAHGLESG